jgi:uncharacterized protein YfeS
LPLTGSAIEEIEVHVYFKSSGGPKRSLESVFERFERFIPSLPEAKYSRKKAKLEISYVSHLGGSEVVKGYGPPKLELFVAGAREIAGELDVLRKKLTPTDDFRTEVFFEALRRKLDALPKDDNELVALKTVLDAQAAVERAAMDEWDKLGIDWDDFHPQSRVLLDAPFLWSCTDDFSPNGNDTGADVLGLFSDWRKSARRSPVAPFLDQLMRDWGIVVPPQADDESMRTVWEEARIGLAFAQLKIDGFCDEGVRAHALEGIAECRGRVVEKLRNWALYDERLRTLEVMEAKLKERLKEVRVC